MITKESGRDDKQLTKPDFNIFDLLGNKIVLLKTESAIFVIDYTGNQIDNATTFFPASATEEFAFKFEYMILNDFVRSGFYRVGYCFMGKCTEADLELFVKNTLQYDDTFAEAIFFITILMSLIVFVLLPWSYHSSIPDSTSKKKTITLFICVVITTALQSQVASLLQSTSLNRNYLQEFDLAVTVYLRIIPIIICFSSLQVVLSSYDDRFDS
jgi:quinol-cytochrome oxidoreductase complex cytochrome b subunit